MMKHKRSILIFLSVAVSIVLGACSDGDSVIGPDSDKNVNAPTGLRAYSDNEAVGLRWNSSVSEFQPNFSHYTIDAVEKATGARTAFTSPKGSTRMRLAGLGNGIRYSIVMHAVTSGGKPSADSAVIEWAPAGRYTRDIDGDLIRVYASTSAFLSALDIRNDSGKTELLALGSSAFTARADLYLSTLNVGTPYLEITSPHVYSFAPGPVTQFSSIPAYDADSLSGLYLTAIPSPSTFTVSTLTIQSGIVTSGKVYFGRLKRGSEYYYFRMLVKKGTDSQLVQGFSFDRYLDLEFSFQNKPNLPFAKR